MIIDKNFIPLSTKNIKKPKSIFIPDIKICIPSEIKININSIKHNKKVFIKKKD